MAVIDGACMGGGLELALGFDYRLAGTQPKTEIGLPEVKIGLIPGWGGTQRLTRLIGPALAAEMICAGETVNAERARELGLVFDAVPSEKLHRRGAAAARLGAAERRLAARPARRKQQPVGLSEEQQSFTFAVARGQVLAKTKGQLPGAAGRPRGHREGLQPAARRGPEGRDRRSSCRWSAARSRAT